MIRSFAFAGLTIAALVSGCGSGKSEPPHAAGSSGSHPHVFTSPSPGADDGPVTPQSCSGDAAQPLDSTWTLTFSGAARTFNVHVPASYDPNKPTPVVLDFHGLTMAAAEEDLLTGMNAKADSTGFIAVEPQGQGTSWNAGACCAPANAENVDDIGFVDAMLDQLEASLCVDPHRIFATGMSNGGFFSHRLGCELAARVAAIAPVAGVEAMPTCNPSRPVPVMEFHGTLDPLVPYGGSTVLGFPSVPDTFSGWAARDGCTGEPTDTYDDNDSHCATYTSCAAGAEVTLCTVDGGGHTWPGGLPVPTLGYTTPYLSATDAMWGFFQAHPLP
jgi:polyhydroxybutyrate depolymerase